MLLKNHIAHTFLTTEEIQAQIMAQYFPEEWAKLHKIREETAGNNALFQQQIEGALSMKFLILSSLIFNENIHNPRGTVKTYYVTNTVLDNLDLLKLKRKNGEYDWAIFKALDKYQKVTFILPDNKMLRMEVLTDAINFCHVEYKKSETGGAIEGGAKWLIFIINRINNVVNTTASEIQGRELDTFIYKLLCFVYLSDIDEVILKPGKTEGTKKKGKTLNNTNYPVTVINSRWNTIVTTGKFGVKGHFHVYHVGTGRTDYKVLFVEPYEKSGYTRGARSTEINP